MQLDDLIQAARGLRPCDLLLANGRIVNVFSGEVHPGGVAVAGGRIAGLGDYPARHVVDLGGRFVAPGFIDSHVHIESSMACVTEFARAVVVHGTTAVVADPHEIANVLGKAGIRYMLESAKGQPINVFYTLPACVPATDMETAGARLAASDLEEFFADPRRGRPGGDDELSRCSAERPGRPAENRGRAAVRPARGRPLPGPLRPGSHGLCRGRHPHRSRVHPRPRSAGKARSRHAHHDPPGDRRPQSRGPAADHHCKIIAAPHVVHGRPPSPRSR